MYMYKLKTVILNISVEIIRIMQWSKQARILLFNLLDRIPITCQSLLSQPGAVCMSQNYYSITLGLSSFAWPVSQWLTSCLWRLRDFSWKGGLNCWIPLHSKTDLEKCGYAATQTCRMQAVFESTHTGWRWLHGYGHFFSYSHIPRGTGGLDNYAAT